jgi:hypothetical protein
VSDARAALADVERAARQLLADYRRDGEEALRRLDSETDPLGECRARLAAADPHGTDPDTVAARRALAELEAALVAAPHPLGDSYWVMPGRLLAGEYPGARDDAQARRQLRRLRWSGVTDFVDLTEAGEYGLRPYAPLLDGATRHARFPIPDRDVPGDGAMRGILDAIDAALADGRTVYLHCFGGIGRTGTVVGCWLVRHGASGEEALRRIADWRTGTSDAWWPSPETDEQRAFVLAWPERGPGAVS